MQPVTFLVEMDVPETSAAQNIAYAAQEMGHPVYATGDKNVKELLQNFVDEPEGPVVLFGCLGTIKELQAMNVPGPMSWCDWDALSCHTYYAHYGKYLLQQEYGFYPFIEIPRIKDFLYRTYGYKNKIFVRPDSNDKVFTGELVGEPQFDYWWKLAQIYEPKPTQLCVVARPERIESEYRFIVARGKVIAGSRYKIAGMMQPDNEYPPGMVKFVEEVAAIWQSHPIFVMDIARLYDGDYKVLEIGPINGAGLYKCEVRPIVRAMAEIARQQ